MTDNAKLTEFLMSRGFKSVQEMREWSDNALANCKERIKKLGNFFNEVYDYEFRHIWIFQRAIEKDLEELEKLLQPEI
jgi:hypothetical protein